MPRRLQNRLRIVFADRAEEIAERRRAEAKLGELQPAIADPVEMPNLHALLASLSAIMRVVVFRQSERLHAWPVIRKPEVGRADIS